MASMPVASVAPASMAPGSMVPADSTIAVALADFTVMPMVIDAVGPTVTFDVSNAGPTPHTLTIRDDADFTLQAAQVLQALHRLLHTGGKIAAAVAERRFC